MSPLLLFLLIHKAAGLHSGPFDSVTRVNQTSPKSSRNEAQELTSASSTSATRLGQLEVVVNFRINPNYKALTLRDIADIQDLNDFNSKATFQKEATFEQGAMLRTGNATDVAIDGKGFFRINGPGGQTFYTRDGSFEIDIKGELTSLDGYPLADKIFVAPGSTAFSISSGGIVSAIPPGQTTAIQIGTIQLATFINPNALKHAHKNLYAETFASGRPCIGMPGENGKSGVVFQEFLETVSTSVVNSTVKSLTTKIAKAIAAKTNEDLKRSSK